MVFLSSWTVVTLLLCSQCIRTDEPVPAGSDLSKTGEIRWQKGGSEGKDHMCWEEVGVFMSKGPQLFQVHTELHEHSYL